MPDATHNAHKWTGGLSGIPAMIGNMTAVAVIIVMFWNSQKASDERSHEDRAMFREELKVMHGDSQRKWEAINANQRATMDMATTMRQESDGQRKAMTDLTAAIKVLTDETRKLKDETKKAVPPNLHQNGSP